MLEENVYICGGAEYIERDGERYIIHELTSLSSVKFSENDNKSSHGVTGEMK